MTIAAVIIAGGRSTRMGREKALAEVAGVPIIQWIIARLTPQVSMVAINTNTDSLGLLGLPLLPDITDRFGTPLAGLHAALDWGRRTGHDRVLTVPSDSPFIPRDLAHRLGDGGPAFAVSGGQSHVLTGVWPTALADMLAETPVRRVRDWAEQCRARPVAWSIEPYDPFFNVNTPAELAEAERIAAEFRP